MDYDSLLRKHRKKLLARPEELAVRLNCGREEIIRIIPHREPFLLVDRLTGIDLSSETITGVRYVRSDEPVFEGHFPGYPIYPGVLQLEMIGQLGLCLYYFIRNQVTEVGRDAVPVPIRATRVLGAVYMEPIYPGSEVRLIARKLDFDGLLARVIGQAVVEERVCCVVISEGYLLGD
ncbi:MAG TPA: 3-hydroxyacyl-ACP dehydratase FabZ family protein [Spirochaetia bacterium]|nr:3-hydroxyacyl-ACP dehydratase FabZ family protein [Spirochaetia bacterium]